MARVDTLISWLKSTCILRICGGACTKLQVQYSSTCPFTVNCFPFQKATRKKTCLVENKSSSPRHMCVQRRLLFHARLLKDYHLFDVPKSRFSLITNHSPFNLPWREGAWRKGYISHLARKWALISPLSDHYIVQLLLHFAEPTPVFPFSRPLTSDQTLHLQATPLCLLRRRSSHTIEIPELACLLRTSGSSNETPRVRVWQGALPEHILPVKHSYD